MTHDEQLQAWVEGRPMHNDDMDQCCPDFSYCQPELLADEKTRKAFAAADDDLRMSFLGIFLSKSIALSNPGVNVYIAGVEDPGHTIQ